MVTYKQGTVFNTDAKAIVNTVNCKGVMGKGIALEFQLRYPEMYKDYVEKCEDESIRIGKVYYYDDESVTIINFPTKYDFKFPSKIEWIEAGLKDFVDTYRRKGIQSVAFPKLGAGNGGLNWNTVKEVMEKYLSTLDIQVYICEDTLTYAEGVEKDMLDKLNEASLISLAKEIGLGTKQLEAIERRKPFDRFWKIERVDGIGMTTYEKIFHYYYEICTGVESEQLTMF